jgi:hypothetical protein
MSEAGRLFVSVTLASGALRAPEPHCRPLERAAEAHRLLESGQTTGPLVLLP